MSEALFNKDYRDMIVCLQKEGVTYEDAASRAVQMQVDGLSLKVISLDDLITNKRASGRPKDRADALTLEKMKARANG